MLNAKEGDTCIMVKADEPWWTEGKEYEVVLNGLGEACLVDDEGDKWEVNYLNNRMSYKLELKEKTNQTHDIKEGQTYVCKCASLAWWTVDKEYKIQKFSNGGLYLTDDDGLNWSYLPNDNLLNQMFKLKEKTNQTHDIKEGQTYVCQLDDLDEWTLDKEYTVQKFSDDNRLYIQDDSTDGWYLPNDKLLNQVFKLKEKKTFDLNKLATAELREYVELLENKEKSDTLLNDFIERMTK